MMTQAAVDVGKTARAMPLPPVETPRARPTYFAVLHTQPGTHPPSSNWTQSLRVIAALAEENPGYLGYDVEETENGLEYAVTHWATPEHIRQWKASVTLIVRDNGLLDRLWGREGCLWPWLDRASEGARSGHHVHP